VSRAPLLVYDAECAFCRRAVARWRARTGARVRYAPLQTPRLLGKLGIDRSAARRSVQLLEPDGRRYQGAAAVFRTLARARGWRWLSVVGRLPLVRTVAEWIYRLIARQRSRAGRIETLLFGRSVAPPSTRLVRALFFRALGGVYLVAFTSLRSQVLGLYGRRGILPVADFLDRIRAHVGPERHRLLPSLLWLDASDRALVRLCDLGQGFAALLVVGVAPRLASAALWVLYLSFVSVGREFLRYQWDALLLESGLYAIIIAPPGLMPRASTEDTPFAARALMRWLAFRLYFESGLCKLQSRDPTWRGCTACAYHYETQPLPTPIAWYAHRLPRRFQQLSTLLTLAIECGVPFFVFAPRRLRRLAFAVLTGLQALIALTGNYGFFNPLTVAVSLWLLDDGSFPRRARRLPPPRRARAWRRWATLAASLPLVALSGAILLARLGWLKRFPRPLVRLCERLAPYHAVNSYGLFAVMTTARPEIVVEGSHDGVTWRAYELRYKPGAPGRRPRFVAPHQPRLDWQMWFAALTPPPPWFEHFLVRLLEGSPEVLALLAENPFPDRPPRFVRALVYDYSMTDGDEKRRSGSWWRRKLVGVYFPPCCLADQKGCSIPQHPVPENRTS
jgi:predicted DCC family thiol-disulfide oxidoreductase YuxK